MRSWPGRSGGSSPLARGLPYRQGPANNPVGIIPARAGFTTLCSSFSSSRTDHPRSRGVYSQEIRPNDSRSGSSPLARGLRPPRHLGRHRPGIIPARAGFTARPRGRRARGGDHPRSRGVYALWRGGRQSYVGSSPLARGLQPPPLPERKTHGIIPARAGFTGRSARSSAAAGDHPRSRGVYSRMVSVVAQPPGSSPLARGLPRVVQGKGHARRIIPARAGFTPTSSSSPSTTRDHPRSRRVYAVLTRRSCFRAGSSPLARGLPIRKETPVMYTRIIPARAGFTTASASAAAAISDHPRSRGVYQTPLRFIYFCMGSSPLAQGLPESRSPTVHRALDHPRSRGVYECPRVFPRPGAGSSPLARGLQHYPHADLMEHRIIPAHAGFTRPVRLRGRAGRDHPRSRGVY